VPPQSYQHFDESFSSVWIETEAQRHSKTGVARVNRGLYSAERCNVEPNSYKKGKRNARAGQGEDGKPTFYKQELSIAWTLSVPAGLFGMALHKTPCLLAGFY